MTLLFCWAFVHRRILALAVFLMIQEHGYPPCAYREEGLSLLESRCRTRTPDGLTTCLHPRRGACIKGRRFACDFSHAPARQILVKGCCFSEHVAHVGHARRIPFFKRLVKRYRFIEHGPHVGHLACVPVFEGLIKCGCSLEHEGHQGNVARVPTADRLIKCDRPSEHTTHRGHLACVPVANRLIKGKCAVKHARHVDNI